MTGRLYRNVRGRVAVEYIRDGCDCNSCVASGMVVACDVRLLPHGTARTATEAGGFLLLIGHFHNHKQGKGVERTGRVRR